MTIDQKTVAAINEKNDDVAKNKRICHKSNVLIIIIINYNKFEKICRKKIDNHAYFNTII